MKDIIKKLELAETQLTGEPSEENAAEALLLIKDALQVLRQTDCSKLLESLEQKLSREYAVRDFAIKAAAMVQQHRANARIDLLQKLIDEFKPIA